MTGFWWVPGILPGSPHYSKILMISFKTAKWELLHKTNLKTTPPQTCVPCLLPQTRVFSQQTNLPIHQPQPITRTALTFVYWPPWTSQSLAALWRFKCHAKNNNVALWKAKVVHKEETVGKEVTGLDFRKQHYLSKSNHIINPLPKSFCSGLLQTHTLTLDVRPALRDCHFTLVKLAALLVLLWGQLHHLEPGR